MKASSQGTILSSILLIGTALVCQRTSAAPARDSGGRDVSVALFSTRTLHAVTVTPVGPNAWTARCALCAHQPLLSPLHVAGTMEVFAGGMIRVSDDATGEAGAAAGLWHLRASKRDHHVDVVLTLPSERYVAAVLNAEASPGMPSQSLRALAIVARTYALNGIHYTATRGHLLANLCDSTECEAMRLEPASSAIEDAARITAGETLWSGARRAEVFFSQNCGGLTEDAGAVWPNLRGIPYLRSHADPYCLRRDTAAWHAEVSLAQLKAIALVEGWRVPANIAAARVTTRSASHRALQIELTGTDGASAAVSATALRFGVGRALGWDRVRSDAYDIAVRDGVLVFDGRGHGHGVGLCQKGAEQMAAEGKSDREILAFYFPGTAVRVLQNDGGWQETRIGALSFRATGAQSARRKAMLLRAWADAQRRFPSPGMIAPEVTFAPSTEIFRQLTSQPGWALASTRDNRIVLQPDAVLLAHESSVAATLLHEMLHVLVGGETGQRAPLWLREGLVEALAGETGDQDGTMSTLQIDDVLSHADSLRQSELAHRAAAARVRALLARYGISAVRGWLSSGVPAGVG